MISRSMIAIAMSISLFASWSGVHAEQRIQTTYLPSGDPASHGITEDELKHLRGLFRDAMAGGEIQGFSVLLAHRGEVVLKEAYGLADLHTQRPYTVDDLVWIASSTKPFSATVLMALHESGTLDLDKPIATYLSEFKDIEIDGGTTPKTLPTTRMALSHTSGLLKAWYGSVFAKNEAGEYSFPTKEEMLQQRVGTEFGNALLNEAEYHTLQEMVELVAHYGLEDEPATRFNYSGSAFSVAGRVAEVAAGAPFQDIMRRVMLAPLGMERTTFDPPPAELKTMPVIYTRASGSLEPFPRVHPPAGHRKLVVPSGSLASTLDECAVFLQMHLNGGEMGETRVLSERGVEEMRRNYSEGLAGVRAEGYGLGWRLSRYDTDGKPQTISHGGAWGTSLWFDVDHQIVGVYFTQMHRPPRSSRQLSAAIQKEARRILSK